MKKNNNIQDNILWTSVVLVTLVALETHARYTETMDPNGLIRNLKDYGLVDDQGKTDQSKKLQQAIDEIAEQGGGRLVMPKGTYRFANVYLKSNVHLLIEKDTVIKPYWPKGTKTVVFLLDVETPSSKNEAMSKDREYIQNVSIRGLGGRFIVDYSDRERREGERQLHRLLWSHNESNPIENQECERLGSVPCNRWNHAELPHLQRQSWIRPGPVTRCAIGAL